MSTLWFSGKTAIVTGSSRGIGRAIALTFATEGAKVAVNGRNQEDTKMVAELIRSRGGEAVAIVGDVTREEDVTRLVNETLGTFGTVDILVNNAGGGAPPWPLERIELGAWGREIKANLTGAFLCSRAVIGEMKKRAWGRLSIYPPRQEEAEANWPA